MIGVSLTRRCSARRLPASISLLKYVTRSRCYLTLQWAARGYADSLTGSRALNVVGLQTWLKDRFQKLVFQFTLFLIDVAFWWTRLQQRELSFCGYN